uniref:Uncharacterized protein n=1 Tax=Podoviridae sp. ctU7u6 TaxID=2825252 RepID=A0A8S5P9K7_9CAUD|nr:MAG TPA: hypothetical protein [Podoviridae sp. ctU7u6]
MSSLTTRYGIFRTAVFTYFYCFSLYSLYIE